MTGVNWSPGIVNPFRQLGRFGESLDTVLDTVLAQQRTGRDEPVVLVLHMSCPRRRLIFQGKHHRYDNGHDLVYRDGYLYVTAQNDSRFGILKVNDARVRALAEGK